jgi:Zn-dependent peptidase ImmA (M78 family)
VRSRYDVAHELGHLLLHRNLDRATLEKKAEFNEVEKQAHRFAAAFLLPAESFARELYSIAPDSFRALKLKWAVSIQMMTMRAEDLDLISTEQKTRLFMHYSRRGWRTQEPLDDQLPVEQPRLIRKAVELLVSERVQSRAEILDALPYAANDIEELAGLPRGFLAEEQPHIQILGRDASTPPRDDKIIPFRKGRGV